MNAKYDRVVRNNMCVCVHTRVCVLKRPALLLILRLVIRVEKQKVVIHDVLPACKTKKNYTYNSSKLLAATVFLESIYPLIRY